MAWPIAIGAGLGGLMGLAGRDSNRTIGQSSQGSSSSSSQSQGSWSPHPYAHPFYGYAAEQGGYLMQSPVPYFPGQGYVGPSAPTQLGVGAQMQASNLGLQGAQNLYNQAGASQPYYQQGAGFGMQGLPHYQQSAGLFSGAATPYQQASGMAPGVANQFGNASGLAQGAIGGQVGLNNTSMGNYNFLSGAADVANNPYVQGQLRANERSVNKNLLENVLPQVNQGAQQVNALGSSRHGLMQGQAIGDAAEALANTNASTMLNAYGQGLGAQQTALGQTGQMLNNQLAPARSAAYGAQLGREGMNTMALGGQYLENAGTAQQKAGQAYGLGMNQAGQAGQLMQQGNQDYLRNLMGAQGLSNNAIAGMQGAGETVEKYQQRALDDAKTRFAYQYQEPYQRLQLAPGLAGLFQPMGTGYGSQAGYGVNSGYGMGANPNYQSPGQAFLGGALSGAGVGSYF